MQTVILNIKSKSDIKLLTDLAKKIGVNTKVLSETDVELIGLSNAIKEVSTKEFVNTERYLKKLRK